MKKEKIIYWVTTGLISFMMLMGAFGYFTNPDMVGAFKQLGFPDWFRVELGVAKIVGTFALLIPQVPTKFKEWAYAGITIILISAAIAHSQMGDTKGMIAPLVGLALLWVSNWFLPKAQNA
jgi:DoxX-like family